VPRLSQRLPCAPYSAGLLLAAGLVVAAGGAWAQQNTLVNPDPLSPRLDSDPRKPPRFQTFTRPPLEPLDAPRTLTPPPSGAGATGFDSSNTGVRRQRVRPGGDASGANAPADRPAAAQSQQQQQMSSYQIPPDETAQDAQAQQPAQDGATLENAFGEAPGTPAVDDIGPIRKPLKKRRDREPEDPYEALGIRAGAFDLYPAIELYGGYDTNPERSANGSGARVWTFAPELRAQSNWSRHELKADLRGSYTGYDPDTEPTLSRPHAEGKVDGRIDVTRQTRIDLTGRALVSTDNPGSPNLRAGLTELPIFTTFGGSAGIGHRFNRFDLSVRGTAERTEYQDSKLTDGTTASNDDRNYNQYGGALRGGYELMPGVMPFAEVSADERVHDVATDLSGFQRDSKGITGKLGSTFELTRVLTGEFALGYTKRTYDDTRLQEVKGLIGDASLIWTATALTTVKLTAASTVGESTIPGVSGILYRDAGLQVDHAFRRWLIGSLKAGFGLDDYVGSDREDQRYMVGAGLTYKVNRTLHIKGEFRQEWLRSNVTGEDNTASIFLVGIRLQR
jgi:hypothetical protein